MRNNHIKIYYEECNCKTMLDYPFFLEKLKQVQKLTKTTIDHYHPIIKKNYCDNCSANKYYQLKNIIWPNNIKHIMKTHKFYPSEFFIKLILYCVIKDNTIINPPLVIDPNKLSAFTYVVLHYNKLLILDALMKQGSHTRYLVKSDNMEKYIYSEHSGVITIENSLVKNIIVAADNNRIDVNDDNIYLPTNTDILAKHPILFHTHPVTQNGSIDKKSANIYAGRLSEGIIYEFPSANDVLNFVKYRRDGVAQASIVISPEGIYVIRPIIYYYPNKVTEIFHKHLHKFIIKLENMAVNQYGNISNISDPDIFHQNISLDLTYIKMYNDFIKKSNLFIEFYSRQKKNNEWTLPEISLAYVNSNNN